MYCGDVPLRLTKNVIESSISIRVCVPLVDLKFSKVEDIAKTGVLKHSCVSSGVCTIPVSFIDIATKQGIYLIKYTYCEKCGKVVYSYD